MITTTMGRQTSKAISARYCVVMKQGWNHVRVSSLKLQGPPARLLTVRGKAFAGSNSKVNGGGKWMSSIWPLRYHRIQKQFEHRPGDPLIKSRRSRFNVQIPIGVPGRP